MKLEDFKVGQIWETRNEKARGSIAAVADYQSDYPIKLAWDDPLPDFVAERPMLKDNCSWDLFRADGGLNLMQPNPTESEWDLVRMIQTPMPTLPPHDPRLDINDEQLLNLRKRDSKEAGGL